MSSGEPNAAENLGRAIQLRRVELGMKRRELAQEAQLSYPYVSEIENGQKEPSAKALRQLAQALRLTSSDLVRLTDRLGNEESTSLLVESEGVRSTPPSDVSMHLPPPYLTDASQSASTRSPSDPLERRITEAIARAIHSELSYWTSNILPRIVRDEIAAAVEAEKLR